MSTPSIPGVDRDALVEAIREYVVIHAINEITTDTLAGVALAYIAARHECPVLPSGTSPTVLRLAAGDVRGMHLGFGGLPRSLPGTLDALADALEGAGGPQAPPACDREHDDEWVDVDEETWLNLPPGVRARREWVTGDGDTHPRRLVHRDDLPADPADRCPHSVYDRVDGTTSECSLPSGHAPTAHDSGDGVLWTDGEHWKDEESNLNDLPSDPRALIARELGPAKADVFLGLLDEHGWTVTRKEER